jgi:hypothetical protein
MANLTIPSPSNLREGYVRLRSRLANMKDKGERAAIEVGRTGVGILGAGSMALANGYFNNPKIAGIRVDAAVGGVVKSAAVLLGLASTSDTGSQLLGALGDSMIWTAVASKMERVGLEASAEANEVTPLEIIQRRESGLNDDGSAADSEEPEDGRPGAG